MDFKKWLKQQDYTRCPRSEQGEQGNFIGLPTNGDSFNRFRADKLPKGQWELKARWKAEKALGRPFLNIDVNEYLNRGYYSIDSLTLPDHSEWKHQKEKPNNLKISFHKDFSAWGVSENPYLRNVMPWNGFIGPTRPLQQIFKDDATRTMQPPADDKPF